MRRWQWVAGAALLAATAAGCSSNEQQFSGPAGTPVEAPASGQTETVGVAGLVDPAWVERVAGEAGIPARALAAYAGADHAVREETGCTVGWNTLAGIGRIESVHGAIFGGSIGEDGRATEDIVGIPLDGTNETVAIGDTDGGALDGDTEWDRAVGPMQFIPQTWEQWGADGNGDGVADPQHIDDAALAAARYLCSVRDSGLEDSQNWIAAIRGYNNSVQYQHDVAVAAQEYGQHA